jgi:uncharacterized protein (TIGR02453 family)
MKQIEIDIYPPFTGFPKKGLDFLRRLKVNNNREWFTGRKEEYEEFVKFPMESLVAEIRERLAPGFLADPKKSIFRIYRDVRFSKNKAPYKTHIAAVFHLQGKKESACFYVHVEPGEIYAGGGKYMPSGPQLKKIRQSIASHADEFKGIVESPKFRRRFGSLEGEQLQRAPLGFRPEDPMVDYLKRKSFFAGVTWKDAVCLDRQFTEKVTGVYDDLLPLVKFLNRAIGFDVR